jgi:hypothetical protein
MLERRVGAKLYSEPEPPLGQVARARGLERDWEAIATRQDEVGGPHSQDLELVGLEIERRAGSPASAPPRVDNLNIDLKLDATVGQSGHL